MSDVALSRFYVLAAALLFSTGGAAIKLVTLSSWQIAGFRSGLAALALWLAIPAWRHFWEPRALLVGCAYAATMILYVTANTLTTAANSIFLQTTAPLYVLLLAPRLLGERNRPRDIAVAGMLAVGLALFFVGSEPEFPTAPEPMRGNALAAASGVSWALTLLGLRWLARERPASGTDATGTDPTGAAVVAGNGLACLVCLPFALPVLESAPIDWAVIGYLGLVQIGLAYACMVRGVRGVRAIEASLLLVLEPVLSAVWAWWIHGEYPGRWSLAGCALILAGLTTLAFRRPEQGAGG